jgi:hypothetical protein
MSASDIQPWLQPIATVLAASVAIVGLGISHWLTSKRDLIAEKRKIQINFMLEAYRKLEQGSCRGANQDQYAEEFHSAIADIQLLGSPEQVRVAQRIAVALGSGSGEMITINELLNVLRAELRTELNLPSVGGKLVILRKPEELGQTSGAKHGL